MHRYIIRTDDGIYQYERSTEKGSYTARTTYGPDINKARLFNNKSAAMNSFNYNAGPNYWNKRYW